MTRSHDIDTIVTISDAGRELAKAMEIAESMCNREWPRRAVPYEPAYRHPSDPDSPPAEDRIESQAKYIAGEVRTRATYYAGGRKRSYAEDVTERLTSGKLCEQMDSLVVECAQRNVDPQSIAAELIRIVNEAIDEIAGDEVDNGEDE